MNTKLQQVMQQNGDSQQDLANYLGLRGYQSIYKRMYGKTPWTKDEIEKVCKKYKKTKEQLGF